MLQRHHTLKAVARQLGVSYATIKSRMADIRRNPRTMTTEADLIAQACQRTLAGLDGREGRRSFDELVQGIRIALEGAVVRAFAKFTDDLKRAAERELVNDVAQAVLAERHR